MASEPPSPTAPAIARNVDSKGPTEAGQLDHSDHVREASPIHEQVTPSLEGPNLFVEDDWHSLQRQLAIEAVRHGLTQNLVDPEQYFANGFPIKEEDSDTVHASSKDAQQIEDMFAAPLDDHADLEIMEEPSDSCSPSQPVQRPRVTRPRNAREVYARLREQEKSKPRSKISIPGFGRLPATRSIKSTRSAKSLSRSASKRSKGGIAGDADALRSAEEKLLEEANLRGSMMLLSLLHNDAIADRVEHGDLPTVALIAETKNKERMAEELLASALTGNTKENRNDKEMLMKASRNFGYGNMKPSKGKWLLKGMTSDLLHHLENAWGRLDAEERMRGDITMYGCLVALYVSTARLSLAAGGMLCDGMGIGKTIETLTTMVANPPDPKAGEPKTTLLVVRSSLVRQWQTEIRKHVKRELFPQVDLYKTLCHASLDTLQTVDVMIATYAEFWTKLTPLKSVKCDPGRMDQIDPDPESQYANLVGLLGAGWNASLGTDRNPNSKSTRRVAPSRISKIGSCLRREPKLMDQYFRFLRVDWAPNLSTFQKYFNDIDDVESQRRLHVLLSVMMLRRTGQEKLLGFPILPLPRIIPTVLKIKFGEVDRAVYEMIEGKYRDGLNQKRWTAAKAQGSLREKVIRDLFTLEDIKKLKDIVTDAAADGPLHMSIRNLVDEKVGSQGPSTESTSTSATEQPTAQAFGRTTFGTNFPLDKYLATCEDSNLLDRTVCNICEDVAEDPHMTNCGHVFCKLCLLIRRQKQAQEEAANAMKCPQCSTIIDELEAVKPFDHLQSASPTPAMTNDECGDDNSSDDDDDDGIETAKTKKKKKRKRTALESKSEHEWINLGDEMLPSSKLVAVKSAILKWQREAPEDKIVIFTQFRLMIRILRKMCKAEGWGVVSYHGAMTLQARQKAVMRFTDVPEIKIMVAGLKCCGEGLNLMAANRVISIDLWWNYAVDQQAFGRVLRYGQTKETHFLRIVVDDTVDERLLEMQERKMKMVNAALMDDGKPVERPSIQEMASLFGFLTTDAHGNPYIEKRKTTGKDS
ncbi:MAG: hypothetical protein M1817_005251 [Caeruleum heppii]|nr:MAG: hypothetical protein M1817_005251 [Caeruleum heppii]